MSSKIMLDDCWNVNTTSICEIIGSEELPSKRELESFLCNTDIRDYGEPVLVNLPKTEATIQKPIVLQVNNWRNVSSPKSSFSSVKDDLKHGGLVRFFLTDGHSSISGLSSEDFSRLGLSMGCKIRLNANCPIESGFLMLSTKVLTVLGGTVERLRIRAEKERSEHFRIDVGGRNKISQTADRDEPGLQNVPALNKPTEEDKALFDENRQKNIANVEGGRVKSSFTTPNIQPPPKVERQFEEKPYKEKNVSNRGHDRQAGKRRGRKGDDDDEVPAEYSRPSGPSTLFDFLAPGAAAAVPQAQNVNQQFTSRNDYQHHHQRDTRGDNRNYKSNDFKERPNDQRRGDQRYLNTQRREPQNTTRRDQHAQNTPRGGHQSQNRQRGDHQNQNTPRDFNRGGDNRQREQKPFDKPRGNRNVNDLNNFQGKTFYSKGQRNQDNRPNTAPSKPAVFFEDDFPAMDVAAQEFHQMNLAANAPSSSKNSKPSKGAPKWKVQDKCLALWEDGEFYSATILSLGPGSQCTVRYNEYGNVHTLDQGVLLTL